MPNPNNPLEQFPVQNIPSNSSFENGQKENIVSPERTAEIQKEQQLSSPNNQTATPNVSASTAIQQNQIVKDELYKKIDDVLEEGLHDIYMQMPKNKQEEFRIKGEETANNIKTILKSTKVQLRKILDLIANWLFIIPGVNKFFVRQESKIKTDKILQISKEKQESENKN